MGQIAAALRHLIAAGVTGEALVKAVEDMEASVVVQTQEPSARSKGAERQARYRARKSDGGGGDGRVTRDDGDACDVTTVTNVTVGDADRNLSPQTPLSNNFTSPDLDASARDTRIALLGKTTEIIEAATRLINGSADWTQPNMHRADLFIELMAPMNGVPCDWDLDIGPAIQAASAKLHPSGKRLTSWNYIRPIAIENRDRRLAGLPDPKTPEPINERARERAAGSGRTDGTRPQPGGNGGEAGLLRRRMERRLAEASAGYETAGEAGCGDVFDHPPAAVAYG